MVLCKVATGVWGAWTRRGLAVDSPWTRRGLAVEEVDTKEL
jgi:hypothetical protein